MKCTWLDTNSMFYRPFLPAIGACKENKRGLHGESNRITPIEKSLTALKVKYLHDIKTIHILK